MQPALAAAIGAIATLAGFAATPALAAAPCRLPPPGLAAEGSCSWWLNHGPAVVDNSTCCRPLIQRATKKEDEGVEHDKKARDPKLSSQERNRERQLANDAFNKRSELLVKFRDCVNDVIHALNVQAQTGASPAGAIAAACGCNTAQNIAKVGWRCCVNQRRSSYQVDLNILSDNTSPDHNYPYNCHYYTKNYISTVAPGAPYPDRGLFSDVDCLRMGDRYGFKRVQGVAHVGDIVLTEQPGAIPGCNWSHSGIITAVDRNGIPKWVRQKDGPNSCVVDLTWDEFNKAWVDATGTHATILTLPGHSGRIP